jgi:hypothetical protein
MVWEDREMQSNLVRLSEACSQKSNSVMLMRRAVLGNNTRYCNTNTTASLAGTTTARFWPLRVARCFPH